MSTKTISKIKTEVTFNNDLTRLVDVMKSIAGAQYHIMEKKRTELEKYKAAVEELCAVYDFRSSAHPFIQPKNDKKVICLITTDFGFLGGLNMKVVQAGIKLQKRGAHYLVIGERGVNYIREYGYSFSSFSGVNPDETRYDLAAKVQKEIFRLILKQDYGQAQLVFPHAASITVQKIQILNLIPCPIFFKNWTSEPVSEEMQEKEVILESPSEPLIEMLTQYWLRARLIEVFESSKLSEYGARMMHLEDSFQTLSKIDKKLKLEYFKVRREKIDQSLRESFSSQAICK